MQQTLSNNIEESVRSASSTIATKLDESTLADSKLSYLLQLADNALILAQRNAEWCGHGPILEQDIAITNIALDLLGQARNFYQYAALLINQQHTSSDDSSLKKETITEDTLAYFRTEREFKNCLLTEQPNGDWAQTILRQFLFSNYQYFLYRQLQQSKDEQLAAIAAKSLMEVTYHLRWSSEWVIRLGDSTAESHQRMTNAINELWQYTGELFQPASYETSLTETGIAVDISIIKNKWMEKAVAVFTEATLTIPEKTFMQQGGKEGMHTEHMGYILTELQYLQKTYPGCNW
ncbi:phenylacetate-CoA oxygenase subunit PaaC [soil metagenome]